MQGLGGELKLSGGIGKPVAGFKEKSDNITCAFL